jgi:chromosome segregation ATPase
VQNLVIENDVLRKKLEVLQADLAEKSNMVHLFLTSQEPHQDMNAEKSDPISESTQENNGTPLEKNSLEPDSSISQGNNGKQDSEKIAQLQTALATFMKRCEEKELESLSKSGELHQLQQKHDQLEKCFIEVKKEKKDADESKERLALSNQGLELQLFNLKDEIAHRKEEIAQLIHQKELAEKQMSEERDGLRLSLTMETEQGQVQCAILKSKLEEEEKKETRLMKDLQWSRSLLQGAETLARTEAEKAAKLEAELSTAIVDRDTYKKLADQHDAISKDYEVLKASQHRSALTIKELEEELKQLRQSENTSRRHLRDLESEHSENSTKLKECAQELEGAKQRLEIFSNENETAKQALAASVTERESLGIQLKSITEANVDLEVKLKVLEKKSSQMIKDLQKQLKDKRKDEHGGDIPSPLSADSRNQQSSSNLIALISNAHSDQQQSPDATNTENIQLHDKINRLTNDLEAKSKLLQQYILKDHQGILERTINQSKGRAGLSLAALSSANSLQKMDHSLLVEINMKLQTLLEEQTLKAGQLQEDVARLHLELTKPPKNEPRTSKFAVG